MVDATSILPPTATNLGYLSFGSHTWTSLYSCLLLLGSREDQVAHCQDDEEQQESTCYPPPDADGGVVVSWGTGSSRYGGCTGCSSCAREDISYTCQGVESRSSSVDDSAGRREGVGTGWHVVRSLYDVAGRRCCLARVVGITSITSAQ